MDNQDKKRHLIIKAASKRFAHFGISKTTMSEIAKDLSLSKALLYYYFPDKITLYTAVLEYIADLMISKIKKETIAIHNPEQAFHYLIDQRLSFILKYYNLLDFHAHMHLLKHPEVLSMIERISSTEKKLISNLLQEGTKRKQLEVDDPDYMADIILYAMIGMRFSVVKHPTEWTFPQKSDIDEIAKKQKVLVSILLKGVQFKIV